MEYPELLRSLRDGDRRALAKAITLVESNRTADREQSRRLIGELGEAAGQSLRVGISGPPGVGKSTVIDALGQLLLARGQRVAVLAVDPSSPVGGGSILGDKTRMASLARDQRAFIRPSPSGGALGGVAYRSRETLLLCEAAGYDITLIETVGVGQSEHEVARMVDFFLLLLQPGAGDSLQGIKRGIVELADGVAVNKCDGEQAAPARRTREEYAGALRLFHGDVDEAPAVLCCSAASGEGMAELWEMISVHCEAARASGVLQSRRTAQRRAWFRQLLQELLASELRDEPVAAQLEREVAAGETAPAEAAERFLAVWRGRSSR